MLGVSLTSREGELKNTDDLLMEVSDALKDIESPADRVRIAFDLFGRSGVNLVNALQDGSEQYKSLEMILTQSHLNSLKDKVKQLRKLMIYLML